VLGGALGSKWAIALPAEPLKKVFVVVLLLASIKLIFGK
jgi:uncharacterized membrane protein YfcA